MRQGPTLFAGMAAIIALTASTVAFADPVQNPGPGKLPNDLTSGTPGQGVSCCNGNPPPLSQQTFTLVQENGVDAKPNTAFDVQKTLTLKKGQMLVLKSSSGQEIEVTGPFHGKPLDHYTAFPPNGTMGYDSHSFSPSHKHCGDTSGGTHPSGGPNPDETAGAEAHCH